MKQIRHFKLEINRAVSDRDKTVEASLSSEYPVERPGGMEVLSHAEGSILLDRVPLPLISSHDGSRLNVGLVENIRIVGNRLRGLLRLGDREEAKEIWKDIKSGILKFLSIGYEILETQETREGYVATKWRPYEVSIVAVPADPTVGVNRSKTQKRKNKMEYTKENFQKILKAMQTADGAELSRLGSEYDEVASVVNENAPLVRDSGVKGVLRWARLTSGEERTPLGDPRKSEKRIFESLGDQVRSIIAAGTPGGQVDPRLHQVRAATGANESVPSDGGFLIEPTYSDRILETVWNSSEVLKRIEKYSLGGNSNSLKLPGLDETSRADGSRFGGIQGYWVAAAAQYTATKPKFRMIQLELNKLCCLCYATDELLEDSTAIESYINKAFAGEIAFMIQDAIINGSGAGQPLGILNGGSVISVAKESGQSAATLAWENISKMWARIFATSRKDAIWLINQDCEPQLHSMSVAVGTGGVPVYMPAGGASGKPYNTLFGRPVVPIEQCQTLGTTGDIFLADFKNGYIAIDKQAKFDSSIHLRFDYGEQVLRGTYRFDGQPVLASAVTPYAGTNTLSHFVKLDTRS